VNLTLSTLPTDTSPIDWSQFKSQFQPPSISNDAWDVIFGTFTSAVGSTYGQLQSSVVSDTSDRDAYCGRQKGGIFIWELRDTLRANQTERGKGVGKAAGHEDVTLVRFEEEEQVGDKPAAPPVGGDGPVRPGLPPHPATVPPATPSAGCRTRRTDTKSTPAAAPQRYCAQPPQRDVQPSICASGLM